MTSRSPVRPAAPGAASVPTLERLCRRLAAALSALCLSLAAGAAPAASPPASPPGSDPGPSLGLRVLPATEARRAVWVYYPSSTPAVAVPHGPAVQRLAVDGQAAPGNGRLIVLSHGTGGSPWVHADLVRTLVTAGYVVAAPEHRGDTYADYGDRGTMASPLRRPTEIGLAIDAVIADPVLGLQLDPQRVGVYGMSAGGMTGLTLAGGRWSGARFARHCDEHLAEDFQFCVGVITELTGGWLDSLKLWIARREIRRRFAADQTLHGHRDPRVAAVAVAVPAAALFDPASLVRPVVPLGLVTAGADRWLVPRFHAEAVLAGCSGCERIAHLPQAGHGAYLSPLPPGLDGVLGAMLNDPPGFDRTVLPSVHLGVRDFFDRHLAPAPR